MPWIQLKRIGQRIEALRQLKKAGGRTGALVCPVIPYITDAIKLIDMLEPHTDVIWVYGLSINDYLDQNWLTIQKSLSGHFPDLVEPIKAAVFSTKDLYWSRLRDNLMALKDDRQLNLNIHI